MEHGAADRPAYDQTLKRLLVEAHEGFLRVIAPDVVFRGEMESELRGEPRRADLVWEVEAPDGTRGILHIELQTKPDPSMGERLAEYALRLWLRDHKPIRSLVVYLRPSDAMQNPPSTIADWAGREALRFTYGVVRLWELPPELVLESGYYELWPLAGLMGSVTTESTLALADRIVAARLPPAKREELIRALVLLAGMRISRRALAEALRWRRQMLQDLWEESSLKDALRDLAVEEGEARGREQGVAEAKREDIRAVLEARFGPLDEALSTAIAAADVAVLSALVVPAATETLEQIRIRLGLG